VPGCLQMANIQTKDSREPGERVERKLTDGTELGGEPSGSYIPFSMKEGPDHSIKQHRTQYIN